MGQPDVPWDDKEPFDTAGRSTNDPPEDSWFDSDTVGRTASEFERSMPLALVHAALKPLMAVPPPKLGEREPRSAWERDEYEMAYGQTLVEHHRQSKNQIANELYARIDAAASDPTTPYTERHQHRPVTLWWLGAGAVLAAVVAILVGVPEVAVLILTVVAVLVTAWFDAKYGLVLANEGQQRPARVKSKDEQIVELSARFCADPDSLHEQFESDVEHILAPDMIWRRPFRAD